MASIRTSKELHQEESSEEASDVSEPGNSASTDHPVQKLKDEPEADNEVSGKGNYPDEVEEKDQG